MTRLMCKYDSHDAEEAEENLELINDELRDYFDNHIMPAVIEAYSADDHIAMHEEFNNWTDMLCKDGELSDWAYNNVTLGAEYDV